jgi:hypothetical protein
MQSPHGVLDLPAETEAHSIGGASELLLAYGALDGAITACQLDSLRLHVSNRTVSCQAPPDVGVLASCLPA